MNMHIVPFDPAHIDLIDVREREAVGVFQLPNMKAKLSALATAGECFTFVYSGIILGVVGWIEFWPGVCEVFVVPSKYIGNYRIIFAKRIKENLIHLEKVLKYHRIQVTAVDDELHNRWLKWLGFTQEGVLRKYGVKGEDFIMWSRCKDGN